MQQYERENEVSQFFSGYYAASNESRTHLIDEFASLLAFPFFTLRNPKKNLFSTSSNPMMWITL
jgi:hypothetical protein